MQIEERKEYWMGVCALTLGISALMMAQFLPSGLLSPMAKDLNVTEGMAGQTVTLTSLFAVLASLVISYLTREFNRKIVMTFLASLTFLSCLMTSITSSYTLVLISRAFLGIAIGGYWAMSTAITFRLVKKENIAKALSIVFGGASFAGMLAAPLGSYLGEIIGWQNVFIMNAILGLVAVVWLILSMPALPPKEAIELKTIFRVFKMGTVKFGLIAIFTAFCGRYASLTYLRPFVENELHLDTIYVTILFFIFDVSYFIGTFMASKFVAKYTRASMFYPQLILGILSFGFIIFSQYIYILMIMMLISGMAFANIPISWSSWGPKILPEYSESIGGLFVASTQLSSAFGALVGGLIFDGVGSVGVYIFCGITWLFSTFIARSFVQVPK